MQAHLDSSGKNIPGIKIDSSGKIFLALRLIAQVNIPGIKSDSSGKIFLALRVIAQVKYSWH